MPCGCKKKTAWTPPAKAAGQTAAAGSGPKIWTGSRKAAKTEAK